MVNVPTKTQNQKLHFLSSGDKLSQYKLDLSIRTSIWCQYDAKTASKKSLNLPYRQGYSNTYVLKCISNYTLQNFENVLPKSPLKFFDFCDN